MAHSLMGTRMAVMCSPLTEARPAVMAHSLLMAVSRQAAVMAGSHPMAGSRLTIILTVLMPCRRKSRIRG